MATTVLLSRVLGVFIVIIGTAALLRRQAFAEFVATFSRDRALRILSSAVELLAGLFLVALHRAWDTAPTIIISLFGWMAVLESSAYLLLPDRIVQSFLAPFARPGVIAGCGVVALVLGLYLAAYGFGVL
ncbi:MAG TPA: hypothetical protein VNO53_10235 [Steroidobacteraceae bacterium]|nr:hypothetical protein [Steroidobacteraceae bacterium]